MLDLEKQNRKIAIRAFVNLAVLEGFLLIAVVGVYLYTNNMAYLIGGLIGVTLIFGPLFFRFLKEHRKALRQPAFEKSDHS